MATMPLPEAREILVETRRQIASGPESYEYTDWKDCTCGFLYRVAMDHRARQNKSVANPGRNRYGRLMNVLGPVVPNKRNYPYDVTTAFKLSNFVGGGSTKTAAQKLTELIALFDEHYGPVGMNIGKESPARTITPREIPVPTEVPEREQIPSREPTRTPERTPEQVPAR